MSSKSIGIIIAVIVAIVIIAAAVFLMSGNNDKEETKYTVTLNLDGGESASISADSGWKYDSTAGTWSKEFKSGSEFPLIENPTKADSANARYKFSGWTLELPSVVNASKTCTATYKTEYFAKILVEDQNGVYFWTEGAGATIADCLAKPTPGVSYTLTDSSFGKYVQGINGLDGAADYSSYWALYTYKDGKWESSNLGVSSLQTKDNPVVGFFYVSVGEDYSIVSGGPDKVTVPSVSSANVWDGKTDGTVFCIQGASGLYFYINDATGTTMAERFKAATTAYNVPYEESAYGINSIFGIGTAKKIDSEGNVVIDPVTGYEVWNYWAQYGLKDGAWAYMETTLPNTNANDFAQMAMAYGDGGMGSASGLTAPVYAAS